MSCDFLSLRKRGAFPSAAEGRLTLERDALLKALLELIDDGGRDDDETFEDGLPEGGNARHPEPAR